MTRTEADVAALLRLRRVREERAAAALEMARAAAVRAAAEREQAERSERAYAVLRRSQEAAMFRRLTGEGPVTAGRMLSVSAVLAELQGRAGAMRERSTTAARGHRDALDRTALARQDHATALRRAETTDALSTRLQTQAQAAAERAEEAGDAG